MDPVTVKLEFDLDALSKNPTPNIQNTAIQFLRVMRCVADCSFYHTSYDRKNLLKIFDALNTEEKLDFVRANGRDVDVVPKNHVFDLLNRDGAGRIVEHCTSMFFVYCNWCVNNYGGNGDVLQLVPMAKEVANALTSMHRENLFDLRHVEELSATFVTVLLHKIACMDETTFTDEKASMFPMLVSILKCFKTFEYTRNVILEEILKMLSSMKLYMEHSNKTELDGFQAEIFVDLLLVACDMLKQSRNQHIIMKRERTNAEIKLSQVLEGFKVLLPDYVNMLLNECQSLLATIAFSAS